MSDTDALVAWLTATLDTIERTAREAIYGGDDDGEWLYYEGELSRRATNEDGWVPELTGHSYAGDHAELHDPRAVLARVEAERAVLAAYVRLCAERDETYTNHDEYPPDESWVGRSQHMMEFAVGKMRRGVIHALAWGHRYDAPGHRDEWTPEGVEMQA